VGVGVDDAGADDKTRRIKDLLGWIDHTAIGCRHDRHDAAVANSQVGDNAGRSGAVDDEATADDEIEHCLAPMRI